MNRGIRNNNPLNIRRSATRWQGAREEQKDKSFVQFKSMAYGYRAAWKILQTYYETFRRNNQPFTVRNIISRWAPPKENDTEAYIRTVLQLTGIGGKENLLPPSNVDSYDRLAKLVSAMTCVECGIPLQWVDNEAIFQGYRMAFPENKAELDAYFICSGEGDSYEIFYTPGMNRFMVKP